MALSNQHQTMLALLAYPNPMGLHPDEARWRDFCRAVLTHYGIDYGDNNELERSGPQSAASAAGLTDDPYGCV